MLRKDNVKINTRLRVGNSLPLNVTTVVDTGAGPSVITENLLPQGWRKQTLRAPTKTRIVDASGQTLRTLGRLRVTILVNNESINFPFLVVKTLSVQLILGWDFQKHYVKSIFPE